MEEIKKQFEAKYKFVYEWEDPANFVYKKHKHLGKSSIHLLDGSIEMSFENPNIGKFTLVKGDTLDVPQNEYHTAQVGENGVKFLVGQEFEDDEIE